MPQASAQVAKDDEEVRGKETEGGGGRPGWERRWAKVARLGVKSRTWWGGATAVHVVNQEGETKAKSTP